MNRITSPLYRSARRLAGRNLRRFQRAFIYPAAVRRELSQWKRSGPRVHGKGLTLLIINHCYDQDIDAICRAASGKETIWVMEPTVFHKTVYSFIPEDLPDIYHGNEDPALAPYVKQYHECFIRGLTDTLIETTHLDAMLVTADQFFWLRPLIEEMKSRGVLVVVQDKEGSVCDAPLMDAHADLLRKNFPPIADFYLLWNETSAAFVQKCGVLPERCRVVGQPRSDYFFDSARWPTRKDLGLPEKAKIVLFFTFALDAYTATYYLTPDQRKTWLHLRQEINQALKEVLSQFPNAYLIVKAHPQQHDLRLNRREIRALRMSRSIFLTGAHSANSLIANADIVVGFQTTAMIEAMLTKKPVIYSGWGPSHEEIKHQLLPIYNSGGCAVPRNAEEFKTWLRHYLAASPGPSVSQLNQRKSFTDQYFFQADGQASRRLLDTIQTLAHNHRSFPQPIRREQVYDPL